MRKAFKISCVIFIIIVLSAFIFFKTNLSKPNVASKNTITTQNNYELNKILKTRDYRLIDGKEFIQYELPYSTEEIIKNSKLMFKLSDSLKTENTFFTMLKLNDGNGILAQSQFQSLTIGHLTDKFCILDSAIYSGSIEKDKIIIYPSLDGPTITYNR